ncbi:MAG: C2 family cysteine protease [Bacillota bacterium]
MKNQDNTGIANPFALAEVIAKKKIDWDKVENHEIILETILQTPYEELFDPKFASPLFPGVRLKKDFSLEKIPLEDMIIREDEDGVNTEIGNIDTIDDLIKFLETNRNKDINIRDLVRDPSHNLKLDIDLGKVIPRRLSSFEWPKHLLDLVISKVDITEKDAEWEPVGIDWEDPGHFFNKAADFFDPIQGSVPNCYFIAALSSVAWARPYVIAHKTRSSGTAEADFVCMIKFYQIGSIGSKNQKTAEVEVSEKLPLNAATNNFVYCRSFDPGEIWPGVYEKAFAKWITKNPTDKPDITATGFGNPVTAIRQLTNENNVISKLTKDHSADDLYSFVRANSMSRKTMHPMVASTYSSGDASPDKVTYADANIAANHAYSVLGWFYRNGKKYLVLRNPWGIAWDTGYTINGTWLAYHVDWWKPIVFGARGVFALEAKTFKRYFRRIAVAKN